MISRVQVTGADVITAGFPSGGDWWDPNGEGLCIVGAYQGKGAASRAASYVNLANPGTFDLVEVSGQPSWNTAYGWRDFFTPTCALDTGITIVNLYTVLVQFAGAVSVTAGYAIGGFVGGIIMSPWRTSLPDTAWLKYSAWYLGLAAQVSGNLAVTRNDAYFNGAPQGAAFINIVGPQGSCFIGAYNNAGNPGAPFKYDIHAASVYSCILTDPQVLAVATAMALL